MNACTVCHESLLEAADDPAAAETRVCLTCRETLGVVPMGQPVRPAIPCTRCNGTQFVRVLPRTYGTPRPYPLPLTHEPYIEPGIFGDAVTPLAAAYFGALEVYICEGCGFAEWYCRDPRSLPIGPQYMSERLSYAAKSEYR